MSDKSTFSADEWEKIVEAPMLVTVIMFAVGQHGPLSMVKESAASAKAITNPGNRGAASGLVAEIAPEAKSKQARHDAEHHKGKSMAEVIDACIVDLQAAATALKKLPADEAAGVGSWISTSRRRSRVRRRASASPRPRPSAGSPPPSGSRRRPRAEARASAHPPTTGKTRLQPGRKFGLSEPSAFITSCRATGS